MPHANAIVFEAPQSLSVRQLELKPLEASDLEVEVSFSGISTGTERLLWDGTMPPFPGLGYPLVPGYETVGTVVRAAENASVPVGCQVFIPGSYSFAGVRNLFGGAGSRLIVPHDRVVQVAPELGPRSVLLALAATCYHTVALGGLRHPLVAPDLIVGHGVMGRLLARITLALGLPAPTVWETQPNRRTGGIGYPVIDPKDDARKDYRAIYDVSGDSSLLNTLVARLSPGGEVVLAGFYKQDLSFAFAPAFMREAQIRVAAQWKKHDLLAVTALVETGALSLEDLITHTLNPARAREAYEVAFGDPHCLKMMIDWKA
ncbi:MAG: chlorophyll synthesis pathway protein BchC [Burkholderiales bacterium]|nr:chlorophyll synthesis pathway protein BchC [Burkholderiales bacterium]